MEETDKNYGKTAIMRHGGTLRELTRRKKKEGRKRRRSRLQGKGGRKRRSDRGGRVVRILEKGRY